MANESLTFGTKLSTLHETVALIGDEVLGSLAPLLADCAAKPVVAIASGGSVASARYFERCRTIGRSGSTRTLTPLEFVLIEEDLAGTDVWLFSASGSNPDMRAAFQVARKLCADRIVLVTTNAAGDVANAMSSGDGDIVVLPVADPKDGFLATHSLAAMVFGLLFAFDRRYRDADLRKRAVEQCRTIAAGEAVDRMFPSLRRRDTLLVVHDPRSAAVSAVIESSCWEAALCPTMVADIRNFAHGRHTWIEQHRDSTVLLAVLGGSTEPLWAPISQALSLADRETRIMVDECGMADVAYGIVKALKFVESMGRAAGVDPAAPGHGAFATTIYENRAIEAFGAVAMDALGHKIGCRVAGTDGEAVPGGATVDDWNRFRSDLSRTILRGIVLDYDGTIVTSVNRFEPPTDAIARELDRLVRAGICVGIATGRGGSAGEELRRVLPRDTYDRIVVGYYNGGRVHPLSVNLQSIERTIDPELSPIRQELEGWMRRTDLKIRDSGVQITVEPCDERAAAEVYGMLSSHQAIVSGALVLRRSGHSLDIVAAHVSKRAVVDVLCSSGRCDAKAILTLGDSGAVDGNDFELLSYGSGISVGEVCGDGDGTWTLFGTALTGPSATLSILRSLVIERDGGMRLRFET